MCGFVVSVHISIQSRHAYCNNKCILLLHLLNKRSEWNVQKGEFSRFLHFNRVLHKYSITTLCKGMEVEGPNSRLFRVPIFRDGTRNFPRERDGKRDKNGTKYLSKIFTNIISPLFYKTLFIKPQNLPFFHTHMQWPFLSHHQIFFSP